MINKLFLKALGVAFALNLPAAHAQIAIEPGLWEMTMQMQSSTGRMELGISKMHEQLAEMPQEQRQRMKDALAARGMMDIPSEDGKQIFRICVTPDMASQFEMPIQQIDGCESEFEHEEDNIFYVTYSCDSPPSEGEATITVKSPHAYSAHMKMISSRPNQTEELTIIYEGKWLAEDCGKIRPPVAYR